jgi:hypothetical protein
LQALVDGFNSVAKTVTLPGITVSTDPLTSCEDVDDVPFIDCDQFFATVMMGDLVKAKWLNYTSTSLPADELSLE